MTGNTWGQAFKLTSWGESHGPAVGGVLDGVPPGIPLDITNIQHYLDLRKPGIRKHTSPRQEHDQVEILSGVFEGKTLGTPLSFIIPNTNQRSGDYDKFKDTYRPGHADYTYQKKYGIRDHRGGGRASARETAVRVAAGAIAHQILKNILGNKYIICAAVQQIGKIAGKSAPIDESALLRDYFAADANVIPKWSDYLEETQNAGKSLGALIIFAINGIPAGLGEPVYGRLDAEIAAALMSINAAKAVEIGQGHDSVTAEQGFDEIYSENQSVQFRSNQAGGILGGISSGQPITGSVSFKPTSSTRQTRQTVNQDLTGQAISITGRHDPCVGIRAVPIVWGMLNLVILDQLLRWRSQCGILY